MRSVVIVVLAILATHCRSTVTSKLDSAPPEIAPPTSPEALSGETLRLWDAYVAAETKDRKIQAGCIPRILRAEPSRQRKGMVMFFHGFTACPQQYEAIGARLTALGYDVFLPLLPGHGREPFDGPGGSKDNFQDLPDGANYPRYQAFVDTMNAIAESVRGPRSLAGLSGGASLATGAAIHGKRLWDRVLLYAPYYKNPGIRGLGSAILDVFVPGLVNDWGPDCRANRARMEGRAGLCALKVDHIRAMTDYGIEVSQRTAEIPVPVQFVGVEADPTADDGEIYRAHQRAVTSKLCFYPKGVPHSIINPRADAPELDPYWVPAMQDDSIAFLTQGTWFPSAGISSEYKQDQCRSRLE